MEIVEAGQGQLAEITRLVQTAISEMCKPDHGNQSHHIRNWLGDRSEDKIAALMAISGSKTYVCLETGKIIGVSHITSEGLINLCYVHVDHAGRGTGRQLLEWTEQQARQWGLNEVHLISTTTAREFYLAHGYKQYAEHIMQFEMPGYPMKKIFADVKK